MYVVKFYVIILKLFLLSGLYIYILKNFCSVQTKKLVKWNENQFHGIFFQDCFRFRITRGLKGLLPLFFFAACFRLIGISSSSSSSSSDPSSDASSSSSSEPSVSGFKWSFLKPFFRGIGIPSSESSADLSSFWLFSESSEDSSVLNSLSFLLLWLVEGISLSLSSSSWWSPSSCWL